MINDITTTPDCPPAFIALAITQKGRHMGYPKENKTIQEKHYPDLAPLVYDAPIDSVFTQALQTAESTKHWECVSIQKDKHRIEVVATTPIIGYKDDVVIELRWENGQTSIHMRSKSRLGRGDFGANADRIRHFFKQLKLV